MGHNHFSLKPNDFFRAGAVIFTKEPGTAQAAYHGRSKDEHQQLLDDLTGNQGFRPVSISVVSAGGQRWYAAIYEHRDVGVWEARSTLSPAEYQTQFNDNAAAGRSLVYVNSYLHGGAQFFVGIWHQSGKPGGAAHHLDSVEFEATLEAQRKAGGYVRAITGYQRGAATNWAALWTAQ